MYTPTCRPTSKQGTGRQASAREGWEPARRVLGDLVRTLSVCTPAVVGATISGQRRTWAYPHSTYDAGRVSNEGKSAPVSSSSRPRSGGSRQSLLQGLQKQPVRQYLFLWATVSFVEEHVYYGPHAGLKRCEPTRR